MGGACTGGGRSDTVAFWQPTIINMAAVQAVITNANMLAYAICKGGVKQLTTATALALALGVFVTWKIVGSKYGKLLMAVRDAEGSDSRPMFHPLSSLPAYDGQAEAAVARKRNAGSYRLSPWGINLPSAMNLTRAQVRRVAETLRRILGI